MSNPMNSERADERTPEETSPVIQREDGPEQSGTLAPASEMAQANEIDPYEIAERVYQLMRAELRVECERRGWGK